MMMLLLLLLSSYDIPEGYTKSVLLKIQTVQVEYKLENNMAIDKDQLRQLIADVLDDMGMGGEHAVELLMLTAAQESHLGTYIKQIKGPAEGIFQMEPRTDDDIHLNYLKYKPKLQEVLYEVTGTDPRAWDLRSNLKYQIVMTRLHYRRVPEALPTDVEGYAKYWKEHYNTYLGKGTVSEAIHNYKRLAL